MNMRERPNTIPATLWLIFVGYQVLGFRVVIKVAFDLDVPVGLVLDDGWCGFRDVIEGPDFNSVGLGMIY
jgi:hypothetical protein